MSSRAFWQLASVVLTFTLQSASHAKADTYKILHIGNGNNQESIAVDDYGDYTIDISFTALGPQGCNGVTLGQGQRCYQSYFVNGGYSITGTTPAPLLDDPNPVAGAGCAASVGPEILISCVNGHPIYDVGDAGEAGFNSRGLYYGPSPSDFIANSGTYDGFGVESPSGNFAYVDGLDEYVNLALNETTLATAPTPEPTSLLLLGTGLLSSVTLLRKKRALQ